MWGKLSRAKNDIRPAGLYVQYKSMTHVEALFFPPGWSVVPDWAGHFVDVPDGANAFQKLRGRGPFDCSVWTADACVHPLVYAVPALPGDCTPDARLWLLLTILTHPASTDLYRDEPHEIAGRCFYGPAVVRAAVYDAVLGVEMPVGVAACTLEQLLERMLK